MLAVEQRQLDIFERGGAREQVETLENETEFAVANVGQLIAVEPGDVDAVEQITAARSDDRGSRGCSSASICRSRSSP